MKRSIAAGMMALTGVFLFAAFVLEDIRIHPEVPAGELPWGLILRYAVAMALGGAFVGFALAGLFGRTGILGWPLALIGGLLATSLSGLFGSVFGLLPDLLSDGFSVSDVIQAAAGLLILPFAAGDQPWIVLAVLALIIATHVLCRRSKAG